MLLNRQFFLSLFFCPKCISHFEVFQQTTENSVGYIAVLDLLTCDIFKNTWQAMYLLREGDEW